MQSRIERNHLFAILRALYLSSAAVSMGWIFYNYASLSAVTVPMTVLFGVFAILTVAAAINALRRDRFLRGSSLDVLSLGTQKFLRLVGLTIGVPPILYCIGFAAFVLTFDGSQRALDATTAMSNFESSVFHKTVVLDYINAWIQIRPIEPPPESPSYIPVNSCAPTSSGEPCATNSMNAPSWSPLQAAGPPDSMTPTMDSTTAWASLTRDDQDEWLTLTYAHSIIPSNIQIFEALSPGAISRVCAFDAEGNEIELWHGQDPLLTRGKNAKQDHPWFWHWTLPVAPAKQFETGRLKLYLSSVAVPDWNEIDAVGITTADGVVHWAEGAEASSTYAEADNTTYSPCAQYRMPYSDDDNYIQPWYPEQATGMPDTTGHGDITTAWASATRDDQDEWLEVEFGEPVQTTQMLVYETFNPGALYKIELYDKEGDLECIWQGKDPVSANATHGISRIKVKPESKITKAKLFLASKKVKGWNEIDAVGLRDDKGNIHYATAARASTTYGVADTEQQ